MRRGYQRFALIGAVPAISAVVVDSVDTLAAGTPATVSANIIGGVLHLAFGIPQGAPFAGVNINGVTTLNPGDSATVSVVFDGNAVRLEFGIPRGADGAPGAPGEVTNAALAAAITSVTDSLATGSSANSNGVSTLNLAVSDPPSQMEMQALANKLDELIAALRR